MIPDKEVKKEFKARASKNPERYYAVEVLKQFGFKRRQCTCGTFFWTVTDSLVCGDPACSGGFRFFGDSPAKYHYTYVEVWKKFAEFFKQRGYEPIRRYPVAARWRDDTDFVQASIYDFQPYVVSGEVEPPANPLVVPQFCLRFNDIDNVGITGAHYTGFVMIGQHAFMPPDKWDQNKYFLDIHEWLTKGLGLPLNEITYHEDAWAGGGNFGPCMEYFSRGLELGNQVYMLYQQTEFGPKELKLKVLDMGMGHERNAWFTAGKSTSYEAVFPKVMQKLYARTSFKADEKLVAKFLPYSSYLNVDEVENINEAWEKVAKEIGISVDELKSKIIPLSALYSVAEHSRTLLVALSDGVLPSNVAGGYNLRVLLRRALGFIEKFSWNVSLSEICKWHADELKELFPELSENLHDVDLIISVEQKKFEETRQKSKQIIGRLIAEGISTDKLVEIYDSNGITPEFIKEEAKKVGTKIDIPDNFYALVAERHAQKEQKAATKKTFELNLDGIPATKALYFDDYKFTEFVGKVLKIIDNKFVVLDTTAFYPTSGGQIHDVGTLNNDKVMDVFKQGKVIVHVLESVSFKEGEEVRGMIDKERRFQLAQHHTATHLLNGLLKKMLGNHVWQAGAAKFLDKARLDITHFDNLTQEQLKQIEKEANEIIKKNIRVNKSFMPRAEAEKKYGFLLYQGGVVPGKELRIVEIEGIDVEACGGTHLNSTGEIGEVKIIKSQKIQDGIVRLEYVAGNALHSVSQEKEKFTEELSELLKCDVEQIPGRADELFNKWKNIVKKGKVESAELTSNKRFDGDVVAETSKILKTQPEHLVKTIKRFLMEIDEELKK
ncbi:MAG: alanine--tRNA ligase [Nanoarchaeota archaeon]